MQLVDFYTTCLEFELDPHIDSLIIHNLVQCLIQIDDLLGHLVCQDIGPPQTEGHHEDEKDDHIL